MRGRSATPTPRKRTQTFRSVWPLPAITVLVYGIAWQAAPAFVRGGSPVGGRSDFRFCLVAIANTVAGMTAPTNPFRVSERLDVCSDARDSSSGGRDASVESSWKAHRCVDPVGRISGGGVDRGAAARSLP